MSFFGWALVFIGLGLLSLLALALIGLHLWRGIKALGRDAAAAGDALSGVRTDARGFGD